MSKYLPLFWDWNQKRAVFYRVYINIFGIFLRIPILPLSIDKIGFDFWYRGDNIFWSWKSKKWVSIGCEGVFNTLSDIDQFWIDYKEAEFRCYLRDFKDNPDFIYLKEGDILKNNDEYSDGLTLFIIGGKNTALKEGDKVIKDILFYNPRRSKYD